MNDDLIDFTFRDQHHSNALPHCSAADVLLRDFCSYACLELKIPPDCQNLKVSLARTQRVLDMQLTFDQAGVQSGDQLVFSRGEVEELDVSSMNFSQESSTLTTYTLSILSNEEDVNWSYSISLVEFYEGHPELFFTDYFGTQKIKFMTALEASLKVTNDDVVSQLLENWCHQILLGYRNYAVNYDYLER